jgi:hypothetical protein
MLSIVIKGQHRYLELFGQTYPFSLNKANQFPISGETPTGKPYRLDELNGAAGLPGGAPRNPSLKIDAYDQ